MSGGVWVGTIGGASTTITNDMGDEWVLVDGIDIVDGCSRHIRDSSSNGGNSYPSMLRKMLSPQLSQESASTRQT
jgi:hypothetical protein